MPSRRSLKDAMNADSKLSEFVFGQLESTASANDTDIKRVPLSSIHRTTLQKRRYFDQKQIEDWANHEIRVNGIRSPLWVRQMPGGKAGEYELIAGERRYRAAEFLGFPDIPIRCFELNDRQALMASLVENMQRQDLNPLEEMEGTLEALSLELDKPISEVISFLYQMNNAVKGTVNQNVLVSPEAEAIETIFRMLGRLSWKSFVTTRLPLLKKPNDILVALREGRIEYTKAILISKIKDEVKRKELLETAINENLSVAEVRGWLKSYEIDSKEGPLTISFENTVTDVLLRFKKSKVWADPKRKRQIQKLIDQMEGLMNSSTN
jgi:ParB family transcriptional regulator, chromosome partitioning protein